MAINWQLALRIIAALAGAIASLPPEYDCRAIAGVISDMLHVVCGTTPPEPE